MLNQQEQLKFLIDRFDHYYDSINNKGNAMLVINTFSIGGIAAIYTALHQDVIWTTSLLCYGFLLCLIWGVALILTTWALLPYKKSASNSLVYFGDISNFTEANFLQKFSEQLDEDVTDDLKQQVYLLAKGLTFKFKIIRWATYLMFISYGVLFLAAITLLINLK